MSNLEQNVDIANEPREKIIDADLAVGLAVSGFHVYLDNTDRQLTFETVYDYFDDYGQLKDGHTFTVPMMEVAQYGALEALCEKFESFNDVVRTDGGLHADSGLPGLSLEDYADELLDDEESQFVWRNGQSEWENVRRCILLGETKFLHNFLYDAALDYPSRVADIRDDLNDYETTYFEEKQTNKTFAYAIGNSEPFTVVQLDISAEERKNAVSQALKNVINNFFGERNDMSQPYKNLLEQITPTTEFVHAFEGHLSCLKYALRNAESDKELCISMLDSIKNAESSPQKTIVIKGYDCLPRDAWEDHGVKFTIGQSVDGDMSFYYARVTDGKITRDYEYDYKPNREKVMSDHADKLAEEDIDRGEAIYGADGYLAFPDPESKHLVANISQQDISHNTNADPSAIRGERRGNTMEEITEVIPISEVTPKFLDEFARKTNSFYQTVEQILDDVSECRIRYGVNDSNNTIVFGTLDSEEFDDLIKKSNYDLIPGELRVMASDGMGDSLYDELSDELDRGFHIALSKVENIRQTQDISHNTNAVPTAAKANGQKGSNIMGNTKMECTAMKLNSDSNSKVVATASVVINDEFVLTQMKLVEGKNGLFLSMPQRKFGDEYQDVIIPKSKEAYNQLFNTVKEAYGSLQKSGLDQMKLDKKDPPASSISKIKVSLFEPSKASDTVKAVGRVEIDDSIIISGVTVKHGTNKEGVEKNFVAMPSYMVQNEVGQDTYVEYAHAVTSDFRDRVNNSVFKEYQTLKNTEHRGVKFSELGEKSEIAFKNSMNNQFAAKLMDELDKNKIPYSAKITDTTTLSIKNADKETVDKIKRDLFAKLTAQKNQQQPEQQKTAPSKKQKH